ncbi:MAG: hypothetical protein WCT41_01720 [Candidatus Paceibacterota bacterium]|jgi:hypothetical protein
MEQPPSTETASKKRPWWQWAIIYLIPALLVYGLVQYGMQSNKDGSSLPVLTLPSKGQVVTFTDSGFSPGVLDITKGTVVEFKNASSKSMRVASNPHPIHDEYPARGGCISSTFDSCTNIPPGGTWLFQFDFTGTWGYHDHLNSTDMGTIVVQ